MNDTPYMYMTPEQWREREQEPSDATDNHKRVNISIDPKLLREIDARCAELGMSRSAYLTKAAEGYIDNERSGVKLTKSLETCQQQVQVLREVLDDLMLVTTDFCDDVHRVEGGVSDSAEYYAKNLVTVLMKARETLAETEPKPNK